MLEHRCYFFPRILVLLSILSFSGGCSCTGGEGTPGLGESPESPELPTRIVAIGDLHGDLDAARSALRLAGAIDGNDRWIGEDLVVVQTGDILDRGDQESEIMALFDRLGGEAETFGGAVHVLNGNHEIMNSYLDFRYVTEGGFADFGEAGAAEAGATEAGDLGSPDSLLSSFDPTQRQRVAAFRPGGPSARALAQRPFSLVVESTVFVHGGILPEHVDRGLDGMEAEVHSWLLNEAPQPEWIRGDRSPVWTRLYSDQPNFAACDTLTQVLDRLGVQRMVVGHTVQKTGVTAFCGGRVWCIDVGMAAHYGGRPEVLEIRGDVVRGLRPNSPVY